MRRDYSRAAQLAMSTHRPLVVLLMLAAIVASSQTEAASRHFNLFEPVFADENLDAHTVSAGTTSERARQTGEYARQQAASRTTQTSAGGSQVDLPARVDDLHARQRLPASSNFSWSTTKAVDDDDNWKLGTGNELKKGANLRRQIESYTNAQPVSAQTTSVRKRQTTEPPRHWSALENYYAKLRHSLVDKTYRGAQLNSDERDLALDEIVQEGVGQDASYRYQPIYRGDPSGSAPGKQQFQSVISSSVVPQPSPPFLFPQAEPTISINSHQPGYISTSANSGIGSKGLLMTNLGALTSQPDGVKIIGEQMPITIENHSRPVQQQLQQYHQPVVHTKQAQQLPMPILSWSPAFAQAGAQPSPIGQDKLGPPTNQLDTRILRRLNELWQLQQRARAKHQQETYGQLYDARRALEMQQEESICGLNQNDPLALPVEFPSHMGVYNGTHLSDEDFLCGATWVHERFALTLGSCLKNLPPNASVTVRASEWNHGNNLTEARRASSTAISRRVLRIHVFPRFQFNSSEHNLALLEWLDPLAIDLENPLIVPACLARSRTPLRATNCWAPVRNTTFVEYFDAEGEGETKLRREIKMVRVPVLLFANEEQECLKQTGFEFFNFKHPNYICSADSRPKSSWRSKLNNTDYFGSGIYCNENGYLNLVSILHPMVQGSPSIYGNLDLTYYQIWIRKVIFGESY